MKAPDEIKKALEICANGGIWDCDSCPYGDRDDCWECRIDLYKDAAAYIQQLELERNAAIKDLKMMCVNGNTCAFCKNNGGCAERQTHLDSVASCWQWRGAEVV